MFVDAAKAILEQCPEAVLAVIGNGELEGELRQRALEKGLGDRFGFFPFRQPSSRQLGSIDVLVLSSLWEALPIAILEAMACGVPQVASNVGGTGEALLDGKTGLLFPPENSQALSAAVSKLLLDPGLREEMGAAAKERHASMFRVEGMVEKTAGLYDEVRDADLRPSQSWLATASGLKRAATKRLPSKPASRASSGSAR